MRTQSPVSSCVFSPDGRFFAAAWENQVAFWDTDSCSVIDVCTDYPGDVISIKFSQDSRNLLVICDGGIICVNSIDNFELSTLLKTDPDKNILDADFDSDYSVLIPSGGKNLNSYFLLSFLLRYTSQVIQKKLGGHNGTVFRIETAKQSEKPVAVSTSLDGQALVWDLSSYSLINEFHCNVENALPAVISPDGTKIFYGAADTDATDGADQTAFVLPYNKNAGVQPLLGADTADIPHVFKDGYQFQEWQDTASLTPGPGTPVTEIAAGNADNMDVTALWQKALTVNVTFPSYAEAQSVQLLDTYSEAAVITKPKTEPSVEVTAATPATGGTLNNVVYIVYNIDGTTPVTAGVDDDGAGKLTWTFADTTGLTAGVYRIYVTANYTGTDTTVTPLSGNLYIKITE